MAKVPSDIEIAQAAKIEPILNIAEMVGLNVLDAQPVVQFEMYLN